MIIKLGDHPRLIMDVYPLKTSGFITQIINIEIIKLKRMFVLIRLLLQRIQDAA